MLYSKAVNSPNEAVSNSRMKKVSASQTTDGQKSPTILQRIAEADRTAADECINKHGKLVWALAKQFTASTAEAETATLEIFLDLWKCADRFDSVNCEETDFIILIARRWLIKQKMKAVLASATTLTSA